MNKVLVTGHQGFIGKNLCKRLLQTGIFVINNQCNLDVTEKKQVLSIEHGVQAIIHLAAKTSVPHSFDEPYNTYYTNIVGTLNLLELARLRKISKFIFISTYVYGQPRYLPIDENHPVHSKSPYNRSKLIAEQLCQGYSSDFGIDVVTLRPFYIYGPSYSSHSFISNVIQQIKKNKKVLLSGEHTKRDFLFIEDFVSLVKSILDKFPSQYNLYNAGYGKSFTLEEVSELLAKLLNKKITIEYVKEMRPYDVTDMVADISKVSSAFDWKPTTTLEKGLELSV